MTSALRARWPSHPHRPRPAPSLPRAFTPLELETSCPHAGGKVGQLQLAPVRLLSFGNPWLLRLHVVLVDTAGAPPHSRKELTCFLSQLVVSLLVGAPRVCHRATSWPPKEQGARAGEGGCRKQCLDLKGLLWLFLDPSPQTTCP